jgi:hypothetical protein
MLTFVLIVLFTSKLSVKDHEKILNSKHSDPNSLISITMATITTTYIIVLSYKDQNPLTSKDNQPTNQPTLACYTDISLSSSISMHFLISFLYVSAILIYMIITLFTGDSHYFLFSAT